MGIAIVTGASSGLGWEFVQQLSRNYPHLEEIWAVARRKERLERLQEKCNVKIRPVCLDLTEEAALKELESMLCRERKKVCFLINCAGFGKTGGAGQIKWQSQAEMCRLNTEALTAVTCIALPYMVQRGRILEASSSAAFLPQPGFAAYAASKSYVLSFSRALHQEMKPRRITVTAVCPGPMRTEFFLRASGKAELSGIKRYLMAKPGKVAAKALRDASRGKDISVYGISMKLLSAASKALPHALLLPLVRLVSWENTEK